MQNFPNKLDGISVLPAQEYNNLTSELKNVVTTSGQALTAAETFQLARAIAGYVANGTFYTDSGVANAYILTIVGAKSAAPSYQNGFTANFKVGNTNTGAATINVASLGIKPIKKNNGANDLAAGDLAANTIVQVAYDAAGDYFELVFTQFIANDFLRKDRTSNITTGYTTSAFAIGNSGTGTVTPLISRGHIQTITINGSFTLAAPTDIESGFIEILATNNGTGGYTINASAYTIIQNGYDASPNKQNLLRILKVGSVSYLTIYPVPIAVSTIPSNYNAIINGGMDIWQRGSNFASAADATYLADMWRYTKLVTTGVQTISRSATVPAPDSNTPLLSYSLLATNTTADASIAAGKSVTMAQRIEGSNYAPLAQRPMVLSFWVRSSVTGIYCIGLKNSGNDRSYVAEYTITAPNVFERKTIVIAASPVAGTWNYTSGIGLNINFTLMCGSTYQTSAGSWVTGDFSGTANQVNFLATNGATFYVTGVQLESGTTASPFMADSMPVQLTKCQRYFSKSFLPATTPASNTETSSRVNFPNTNGVGAQAVTFTHNFPIVMRTAPTITTYNPYGAGSEISNGTHTATGTASWSGGDGGFSLVYTVPTGAQTGTNLAYHYTANASL